MPPAGLVRRSPVLSRAAECQQSAQRQKKFDQKFVSARPTQLTQLRLPGARASSEGALRCLQVRVTYLPNAMPSGAQSGSSGAPTQPRAYIVHRTAPPANQYRLC